MPNKKEKDSWFSKYNILIYVIVIIVIIFIIYKFWFCHSEEISECEDKNILDYISCRDNQTKIYHCSIDTEYD